MARKLMRGCLQIAPSSTMGAGIMGCLVTPLSKYVGQFSHGVKHGRGMLVDDSGTFIGEFNRGEKHSMGVLVHKEGCRWEAQFKAGRSWGKG